MAGGGSGPTVPCMRKTFPVIWTLQGDIHNGQLEVTRERIVLTSRTYTLGFPREAILHSVVERGAETRIRGLVPISIDLPGEAILRIASLGGPGSLHEIAALLADARRREAEPVAQRLAGAGT